ncbi:MAG: hypothetical protein IPJ66_10465 [Bacteroidetes bacterium]|nr:hypothetical protein [Bacteroidota bacterium]
MSEDLRSHSLLLPPLLFALAIVFHLPIIPEPESQDGNGHLRGANPSSASVSNPSMVCYPNIGTSDVGLTVTGGYCSGSSTMNGMVHVVNCSQLPKANFIRSDTGLSEAPASLLFRCH